MDIRCDGCRNSLDSGDFNHKITWAHPSRLELDFCGVKCIAKYFRMRAREQKVFEAQRAASIAKWGPDNPRLLTKYR